MLTLRTETCQELWKDLQARRLILIKSPPFSGKTSMAILFSQFLNDNLQKKKFEILNIGLTKGGNVGNFNYSMIDECFKQANDKFDSFKKFFDETSNHKDKTFILIIDEAQMLYKNCEDFLDVIKNKVKANLMVICFAGYGISQPETGISTPIDFNGHKSIQTLKLKESEFLELIHNYNKCGKFVKINKNVAEYIKKLTNMHAGIVKKSLYSINHKFEKYTSSYNDNDIFNYLLSNEFMIDIRETRVLPKTLKKLNPNENFILNLMLIDGVVAHDKSFEKELTKFVQCGLFYTENGQYYHFASPYVSKLFLDYYVRDPSLSSIFDIRNDSKLFDFVLAFVPKIKGNLLKMAEEFQKKKHLYERLWQHEVYQAIGKILRSDISLNIEVPPFECLEEEGKKRRRN